jgi:hypothetical protein
LGYIKARNFIPVLVQVATNQEVEYLEMSLGNTYITDICDLKGNNWNKEDVITIKKPDGTHKTFDQQIIV